MGPYPIRAALSLRRAAGTVGLGGTTMAHETQTATRLAYPTEVWPPDDTEESVVGTDLHQTTIINLRLGINEIAHSRRQAGQPVPWHALDQTVLLGCRRRDGTAYRTQPDVFE